MISLFKCEEDLTSNVPLVWQSSLRNGGSTINLSISPFILARQGQCLFLAFSEGITYEVASKDYWSHKRRIRGRLQTAYHILASRLLAFPLLTGYSHSKFHNQSNPPPILQEKLTNRFLSCTNTLGADTTAITHLPSLSAPASEKALISNSSASVKAVSSEYQNWLSFQSSANASMLNFGFFWPEVAFDFSSAAAFRSSNCFARASRSA